MVLRIAWLVAAGVARGGEEIALVFGDDGRTDSARVILSISDIFSP